MPKESDLIVDTSFRLQAIIRPILGFVGILLHEKQGKKLNPEQRELVKRIDLSAKSWGIVIKHFVELSRCSNGMFHLDETHFNLRQCLEEVQTVLNAKATAQNRRIIYLIDHSIPSFFVGDIRRLYQVLINLLNYALDFSPKPKREIVLSVHHHTDSKTLSFTINGLMIQPNHVACLSSFYCATRPDLSDWNERLTLGLSKKVIELMGGTFNYTEKGVVHFTILAEASNSGEPCQHELQPMRQHLIEPINLTYTMISMSLKLIKTPLPEPIDDFVKTIYSHTIRLQRIINNLQDFYALKNGQLTLKREPFYLRKWIELAINLFTAEASRKGTSITYIMDTQVPKVVIGDALRLYQILYNLLDNAIKFTSRGQITLSIDNLSPNDQNKCDLHFAMQDTGIGIYHDTIDYLFSTYQSPWAFSCHRYEPKGLGLPLNKELVELMGGKIWVESKIREGSTFHFTATFAQVTL